MIRHRLLLVVCLGFVAGILIAQTTDPPVLWPLALLCLSLVVLAAAPRGLMPGALLLGAALGALRLTAFLGDSSNDIARSIGPAPVTVIGQVMGEPKLTRGTLTFLLAPKSVDAPAGERPVTGSIVVHAGRYSFDAQTVPGSGDMLRLAGTLEAPLPNTNPGGFDTRGYLGRRAVRCEMRVVRVGGVQILSSDNAPLHGFTATDAPAAAIQAGLPAESAELVRGVLLGQRHALSPRLLAAFAATGTAHLLATAGLHVGILAWWLERLCTRLRCSRRTAALVIMAALIAYLVLTGIRPAVLRAVLTACLYYGAIVFERAPDLPTSLAAAALVILTIQPTALLESDFQMTFTIVLGLALAMPLWEEAWRATLEKIFQRGMRRAARIGIDLIGVSLIAFFASAPLTVYWFNQLSLVSLPANVLTVPLVALLIPFAVLALVVDLIVPPLGHVVFSVLVAPLTQAILGAIGFFAALPDASVSVASPSMPALLFAYGLLGGLLFWVRIRQLRRGPAWRKTAATARV